MPFGSYYINNNNKNLPCYTLFDKIYAKKP